MIDAVGKETIHNQEDDMAMLYVTAVLEVHVQHGFDDPEWYPPILWSIIKVARFLIIQQAEEMIRSTEDDEQYSLCASAVDFDSDSDSGYLSPEQSPVRRPRRQTRDSGYEAHHQFRLGPADGAHVHEKAYLMSARNVV
ncbi:hypothetical protein LTR53_000021 [Teratosphaeriaceae sp. CCFEE 6253]|nr:hypothetical protein LTR53_000021 [Teratosphaeriaceae sp. CCFEE 6253]